MTQVRIALDVPGPEGDVRAIGAIRATPTRRRTVGDAIVLPAPFSATLVAGVVTVQMAATSANWCWRVDEVMPLGTISATRYVAVPESGSVLGYEDLVDVDPATLDPAVEPEAAWNVALDDANARIAWLEANAEWSEAQIALLKTKVPVVLNTGDPMPPLTTALTLVARSVVVPPIPPLAVVAGTLTTARSTLATSIPVLLPAGVVTGDLLVCIVTNSTTGGTINTPAGWEVAQHLTTFADYRATYVYFYRVTGAVPSAPTFTAGSAGRNVAAMFRVTGVNLTNPLLVNGTSGSRVTNTMNVPALPGSVAGLALSVTNDQATTPNQPIPHQLPSGFVKILELPSVDDTGVTRTVLTIGAQVLATDLGAHSIVAASSIAAGAAQALAIRGL